MRRLVLAVTLLVACGGDDDGGPLTVDGLPTAIVNAQCGAFVRCGLITDVATCRSLDNDVDIDAELVAAVNHGTVIFNANEASLCIAGFGETCEPGRLFEENEHCDLAFEGTVAAGGTCYINAQCISQQCQTVSCPDACCAGTCYGDAAPTRPGVGESCALSTNCLDSYCDPTTELCTALKPAGAQCQDSDECAQGFCSGTCMAYPQAGQPCVSGETSCASIGLYCDTTTQVCTEYALEGETCGTVRCSPAYTCTGSTCVLKPRVGDSCDPETRDCIDDSYCEPTTLRCTAPKPDGASCTSGSECIGDCDYDTSVCKTDPVCT
jgi:hypothetical protein